jgi:hypothetical protein
MQKDCQPSAKKRRRLKSGVSLTDGRASNEGTGEVPSGLERKLDELVSLLKPAPSISPDSGYGGLAQVHVGELQVSGLASLLDADQTLPSARRAFARRGRRMPCHLSGLSRDILPVLVPTGYDEHYAASSTTTASI